VSAGVGFNSVYHLTEVPTFVSGRFIVMFDPQAAYLPNVNPANPGKMLDFVRNRSSMDRMIDQFLPLTAFGCDVLGSRPFDGTLFRFPLRTPQQAERSKLSKQAHPVETMREQLETFAREAPAMLLFLKNVERLQVLEWREGDSGPTCFFQSAISNMSDDLRRRRNFATQAITAEGGQVPTRQVRMEYTLRVASADPRPQARGGFLEETWVVCNVMGGGRATAMATAKEYAHMKLVPWGGVAGRVGVMRRGPEVSAG
jgi:sacsin